MAAEPLELLPPTSAMIYAYALLQLHVLVRLWSWVVCALELDRQPPRSATIKGCHCRIICSSDLVYKHEQFK